MQALYPLHRSTREAKRQSRVYSLSSLDLGSQNGSCSRGEPPSAMPVRPEPRFLLTSYPAFKLLLSPLSLHPSESTSIIHLRFPPPPSPSCIGWPSWTHHRDPGPTDETVTTVIGGYPGPWLPWSVAIPDRDYRDRWLRPGLPAQRPGARPLARSVTRWRHSLLLCSAAPTVSAERKKHSFALNRPAAALRELYWCWIVRIRKP